MDASRFNPWKPSLVKPTVNVSELKKLVLISYSGVGEVVPRCLQQAQFGPKMVTVLRFVCDLKFNLG